jgi:hypothetical protein
MRTLRTVATLLLAACLAAGGARADDQQARTRAALDGLVQAAAALEGGYAGEATAILFNMSDSVAALGATAHQYRETARAAELRCQGRSVALIGEISAAFQRQQALEREQTSLAAELGVQRTRWERDFATLRTRLGELEALRKEAELMNRCRADFGFYMSNFTTCFPIVGQSIFTSRYAQIEDEYKDVTRRRQDITRELNDADARQRGLQDRMARDRAEVEALRARSGVLQDQDRAVRNAIIALSDVTVFWDRAGSLLTVNVTNRLGLLRDLLPTLDQSSNAPVFDAYDRAEIRTLRATLLDFARSVDDRSNFVTDPAICR